MNSLNVRPMYEYEYQNQAMQNYNNLFHRLDFVYSYKIGKSHFRV